MPIGDDTRSHLPLRGGFGLRHEEGACLPLRSTFGQCRRCADACPVQALHVTVSAVELSHACTSCGRCTAACPTQALTLPEMTGWAEPVAKVEAPAVLRVECRQVPAEAHRGHTEIVPCLGALTSGHLLARAAAGVAVQIVDRGWCPGCAAAGGPEAVSEAHPAASSCSQTLLWLDAAAARAPRPEIVHEPLPLSLRPSALPAAPEPAAPVDRRRFFRAALEKPAGRQRAAATPMGADGRAAYPADARQPSPERERQRLALTALAAEQEAGVPAEFFPQLHADARCCDRRLCVALCPTAALTAADEGATAHLRWSADRCIACGTCVRACPESALGLSPHGGRAGWHTLASHRRLRCTACGDVFTPVSDDEASAAQCPACIKSRRFMDDARRQLFGAAR